MDVTPDLLVGLRVLAAQRNMDHRELLMDAVDRYGRTIPAAVELVRRRRRMRTDKLLCKLTDDETAMINTLAEERNMTRSTYMTAVLDAYIPLSARQEH